MIVEIVRHRQMDLGGSFPVTDHVLQRMQERGFSESDLVAVLTYGRPTYSRGALHFFLGRKECKLCRRFGINVRHAENIHAVVDPVSRAVMTIYRNKNTRA